MRAIYIRWWRRGNEVALIHGGLEETAWCCEGSSFVLMVITLSIKHSIDMYSYTLYLDIGWRRTHCIGLPKADAKIQ